MIDCCALYHYQANPAEGTPYYELAQIWPVAANHDGDNVLFRTYAEAETNFLRLEDVFVNKQGEPLVLSVKEDYDSAAWILARVMASPDRPALYAPLAVWAKMFKHPSYRLYCNGYEDEVLFRSDIDCVSGMIQNAAAKAVTPEEEQVWLDALVQWKAATDNLQHGESQNVMVDLIRAFSA